MKLYQYQELTQLDSGSTTYEEDVCNLFNIDKSQTIHKVREDIFNLLKINNTKIKNKYKLGKTWFMVEQEIFERSYEQFAEMDRILAENNNIQNLHKLIAIYFRTRRFNWFKLKYEIQPFSIKNHDANYELIQKHLDMEDANALGLFFYSNAMKYMKNMNIYYLNQAKLKNMSMENKLKP